MPYDHTSLFLAAGISGAALAMTLFLSWLSARTEGFLLSWALGMSLLVMGVVAFSIYAHGGHKELAMPSYGLLVTGFAVVYGSARQFRLGISPLPRALPAAIIGMSLIVLPFLFGWNGLATMMLNFCSAGFLFLTAVEFWKGRAEATASIASMSVLYGLTALSFLLCGIMVLCESPFVMAEPPSNWAEDINAIMCLIGITGIGALSLALNQTRAARRHRADAFTDALTGLFNRRALFDAFGSGPIEARTAIIVFDLDRFKSINDQYGHAMGDDVLKRFAGVLRQNMQPGDYGARLGGEEFALVLPRATPQRASSIAEHIRAHFESEMFETPKGMLCGTVSAGVALAEGQEENFDAVLLRADNALYSAKDNGRNRVFSPGLSLVA